MTPPRRIEDVLHNFGLNYRVESKETRKEDITRAKSEIIDLIKAKMPKKYTEEDFEAILIKESNDLKKIDRGREMLGFNQAIDVMTKALEEL